MKIDYDSAFERYETRFQAQVGPRPVGAYSKFGKHMVKRLSRDEFTEKLDDYVELHAACRAMLDGGTTISDALVHDFEEAAAWVAVKAPDIYAMFRGEIGELQDAAPASVGDPMDLTTDDSAD